MDIYMSIWDEPWSKVMVIIKFIKIAIFLPAGDTIEM
jgi:hypothetical protein